MPSATPFDRISNDFGRRRLDRGHPQFRCKRAAERPVHAHLGATDLVQRGDVALGHVEVAWAMPEQRQYMRARMFVLVGQHRLVNAPVRDRVAFGIGRQEGQFRDFGQGELAGGVTVGAERDIRGAGRHQVEMGGRRPEGGVEDLHLDPAFGDAGDLGCPRNHEVLYHRMRCRQPVRQAQRRFGRQCRNGAKHKREYRSQNLSYVSHRQSSPRHHLSHAATPEIVSQQIYMKTQIFRLKA